MPGQREGEDVNPGRELVVGSPQWRAKISQAYTQVLTFNKNPQGNVSETNAIRALDFLVEQGGANPTEFNDLIGEITGFIEGAGGTVPDSLKAGVDVNSLLSGLGPSSTSSNTRTNIRTQATQGTVSESGSLQRQRTFVDVPTPEEFLDDFETGFRGYLADLQNAGQLSPIGYQLALQQEDDILNDYLGELAQRAARGEQIFETVGANGVPTQVGSRIGQVTERGTVAGERSTTGEQTTGSTTESGTETVPGGGAGGAAGGGGFTNTNQFATDKVEDITRISKDTEKTGTIEDIYERPNLTLVKTLSPQEFLKNQFAQPGQLETFLKSRKGTRDRLGDTQSGAPVIQARRV